MSLSSRGSMLQQIIDRRLAGKNKSIGNRERFLRRYQDQIREAVRKRASTAAASATSSDGEDITLPKRDVSEPVFGHGQGGMREIVHPGNQRIRARRPHRAARRAAAVGQRQRQASDSRRGRGRLRLPPHQGRVHAGLLRRPGAAAPDTHAARPRRRSGRASAPASSSDGTPTNLHVVRSMRGAIGRRIAIGRRSRARAARARRAPRRSSKRSPTDDAASREINELEGARSRRCAQRLERIPYLDPIDLRFRNRVRVPVPTSKAVMFCLMDVSGSMDEARKDLAKRFFILLYLFLTRHYEKIDLVFIRHHTQAQEVDEENFFHATETGGTVVSSALVLMDEIIRARYSPQRVEHLRRAGQRRRQLAPRLRPLPRAAGPTSCCRWCATSPTCRWPRKSRTCGRNTPSCARPTRNFAMRKVADAAQIYPVFRDLFKKEGERRMSDASEASLKHSAADERTGRPSACPARSRLDLRADRDATTSAIRARRSASGSTPTRTSSRSSPPSR